MKFYPLRTATAVALVLGATAAYAQQKSDDGKAAPPQAQRNEQGVPRGEAQKAEPKDRATQGPTQRDPTGKDTKGTAQGQSREQPGKGTAQTEPKDKASRGAAQTEPKDKASKEPVQGNGPSSAPKSSESTKGEAAKGTTAGASSPDQNKNSASSGNRVPLSEQKRTTVHQTILKEKEINRVPNVNFTINVGRRVPRELRLVALPASVILLVSEYRSYRYFMVNDDICIVDPNTYEIVEIINVAGRSAARENGDGLARLVLNDDERMIILREIDMRDGSTMGLGSMTEGAEVPRNVEVRSLPNSIVQKVPKLKGYTFFTAEKRIGIVDPQTSKVQLIIEGPR
jgi:hypothetical protein